MPVAKLIAPTTKQEIPKLRVAAYCRVSSNSADQRNSFATQEHVYTKYIAEKQEWELVDIFADEGLSGMKADNRPEFQRMIRMCELRQIDLILTKSVSRFARNVKEALNYTRKLKLLGIGVQFEEDGINTLAMADEMLLNTFAAIAQEESKSISQNQRLSIVKRMESGEYIASNAPYGYRLVNKKLKIFKPEAEVVCWIFQAYLNGLSIKTIADTLTAQGVPTRSGQEQWKANTITYVLTNEKYIGDTLFQKYYGEMTVPFKKHRNYGEMDQYYAKDTHEPIVEKTIFYAVQSLLKNRQATFKQEKSKNRYPLTSCIRCSECGSFYHRKVRSGVIKWVCSKHAADTTACNSSYYSEERIYDGIITMINKLRFCEEDILGQTIQKLEFAAAAYKRNNRAASQLSQSIAELNANDFFRFCAMGYAENNYDGCGKTPKEQYYLHADGRDDGLQDIDADSPEAFHAWFHDRDRCGGHPWEVCRGGNSTHVDLRVMEDARGYFLYLAGAAWNRTIETVKFYLALTRANIPVYLAEAKMLADRLAEEEKIGIVPEGVLPAYCGSWFPNEHIIDYMNLPSEDREKFLPFCTWYEEKPAALAQREKT